MISNKESARELLGLDKVNQVDYVAIAIASSEAIRSWSKGEVKNPETINYRHVPGGLPTRPPAVRPAATAGSRCDGRRQRKDGPGAWGLRGRGGAPAAV